MGLSHEARADDRDGVADGEADRAAVDVKSPGRGLQPNALDRLVGRTAGRALAAGELLRVDSGFRPAPMVEALSKRGFRSFVREVTPGRFETFFSRG